MAWFLWWFVGLAWAEVVDDEGLRATVQQVAARNPGAVAIVTPNRPDETRVRDVLGPQTRFVYLQAGSPSESGRVLADHSLGCGVHVARSTFDGEGDRRWTATPVGHCGQPPFVPPPEPAPPPLRELPPYLNLTHARISHDRTLATARVFNGLAIAGMAVGTTGLALVAASPCESNGRHPCWLGYAYLSFLGFKGATYAIPLTQIELWLVDKHRRDLGLERRPGLAYAVGAYAVGVVVPILLLSSTGDLPASATVLVLGYGTATIANTAMLYSYRRLDR
jgi:hypothetical protein